MAKIVVIAGMSASGKSTSYCQIDIPEVKIKGLDPKKTFLFNTVSKEIPMKGGNKLYAIPSKGGNDNMFIGNDYAKMFDVLAKINAGSKFENIIMEDAQYLLSMDFFNRRNEMGYEKYAKMGFAFIEMINYFKGMRDDLTVFILMHTDEYKSEEDMFYKLKTIGKMLDEKFTIEGLFSIVLRAKKFMKQRKLQYEFLVKPASENDITKTPLGMFVDEDGKSVSSIPNDLGLVKEALNSYY